MHNTVLFERSGRTEIIILNRPEKLNAWTSEMRSNLCDHLEGLRGNTEVLSVVLTGRGRAFCAGQDLAETASMDPDDHAASQNWITGFERLYRAVRSLDQPVIAALNGTAAGSGFQYALLADLRIGHAGVRMGQPEILSGIPSITGIWSMWSILGKAKTTEFVLTGNLVDGIESKRLGLITELVAEENVLSASIEFAERLGGLPQGAFALTKGRLRDLEEKEFSNAFKAAKVVHTKAFESGEPQREMKRFLTTRNASSR